MLLKIRQCNVFSLLAAAVSSSNRRSINNVLRFEKEEKSLRLHNI